MTLTFGRIDLTKTDYSIELDYKILNPVPLDDIQKVYRAYCKHKNFHSVMPMISGRFAVPGTEVIGYYQHRELVAWSMYRIWDAENCVCDHHAWNYRDPKLALGRRSLQNECAIYRDRGFRAMYFESVEPYMFDIKGFEILGPME